MDDTETDYMHIVNDRPLTMREIREGTIQAFYAGIDEKVEKYLSVEIINESVVLIYAVDQQL